MTDHAPSITCTFQGEPDAFDALMQSLPPQKLIIGIGDSHPTLPPGRYEIEPDPDTPPVEADGKLTISMWIIVRQCIACGAIMGRPNPDCLVCRTVGLDVRRHEPIA